MNATIELRWVWRLKSPLHCGSGISQPGVADRLVQRDSGGMPFLPADAVKGALRMSAEQLACWLGAPQSYDRGEVNRGAPSTPRIQPLHALFGDADRAHYQRGALEGACQMERLSATAINPETGVAKTDTLRRIEVVAAGAAFGARASVWLEDEALVEPAATALVAALLSTESVGGRASAGLGRVDPEDVVLLIQGEPQDMEAVISQERLEALRALLKKEQAPTPRAELKPVEPAAATADRWWRLEITLRDAACLTRTSEIGHQVSTEDVIPATALRGALYALWRKRGAYTDAQIEAWLGPHTRWSPGWPAAGGAPCVPIPRSYLRAKNRGGFGTSEGVRDLLGEPRGSREASSKVKWAAFRGGWMHAEEDGDGALEVADATPQREVRMHVARDYVRGGKRVGALYSREALTPDGATFVAWARLPAGSPLEGGGEHTIHLGKRRSASGRAKLVAREAQPRAAGAARGDVFVQLLSPALVLDPESGHPLRTLGPAAWARLTGVALDPAETRAFSATRRIGGWVSSWGHPRARVVCVDAGSAWRLRCKRAADAPALRAVLAALADAGLGERRHEGFGWLAVDPPWLGRAERLAVAEGAAEEAPFEGGPRPWPGCESVDPATLRGFIDRINVDHARLPLTLRGPLRALATQAREASGPADVQAIQDFIKGRVEREEPGQWRPLKARALRGFLDDAVKEGPEALRFVLAALMVRADRPREGER